MSFANTLNRRVRILAPLVGEGTSGEQIITWPELATVWANVRFLGGLETLRAGAVTATTKASVRIRRRADVTAAMRLVYDGVTYDIKSVQPDDRRVWIDLVCESVPA